MDFEGSLYKEFYKHPPVEIVHDKSFKEENNTYWTF